VAEPKQYDPFPLREVTPNIKDEPGGPPRVRDAQWLMQGNTRFGPELAPYKDGKLDKQYGPLSAQATQRLRYWIGYPDAACRGSVGETFDQLLYERVRPQKWRELPPEFRRRRSERLKAAAKTPGMKALDVAITQLGYRESEPPYDFRNGTKYGAWFGWNGVAWCAIFDSWCFWQSGYKLRGQTSKGYASVPLILSDAQRSRNGLRIVRSPMPGDLAIHSVHGDRAAHVSFFYKPIDGASFRDLGGNTGPTNIANGGMVLDQVRSYRRITAFVRVGG
jgi:hypothetical protein